MINCIDLTVAQWRQVIVEAQFASESNLYMYVLRSWANQQAVTKASICAFRGKVIDIEKDVPSFKTTGQTIANITRWVRKVTKDKQAICYKRNKVRQEWVIGFDQAESLRKALYSKKVTDRYLDY